MVLASIEKGALISILVTPPVESEFDFVKLHIQGSNRVANKQREHM